MAQILDPSHSGPPEPKILPPHQEAMIEACKTGRLAELRKLFDEHSIKRGDDPVQYLPATQEGAPETRLLFASAISFGHESIIQYLHSTYPKYNFSNGTIVHALLQKPDLQILKLIYSYSPELVHFGYDDNMTTFLSKACQGGPDNAAFISFLLDHEARTSSDGDYRWHFGGALLDALEHNQSTEIIRKMIPTTDRLVFPISSAFHRKRADALELLLNAKLARSQTPSDVLFARSFLTDDRANGDKKVIAVLERYIHKRERQMKKSRRRRGSQAEKPNETGEAAAGEKNSADVKPEESRRWWQFLTRAKPKGFNTSTDPPRHKNKEEPNDLTSDEDSLKHS